MQDGQVVLRMVVTGDTAVLIQDSVDCAPTAQVVESGSQEESCIGGRDGIQICCRRVGGKCEHFIHCGLYVLNVLHRSSHLCVGRAFTRVYECL